MGVKHRPRSSKMRLGRRDAQLYTQAGPVTIRHADGATETKPPLDPETYQEVVKVRWDIPLRVRQRLMVRDGGRCRYCGNPADAIDHVVPIALGGSNRVRNLVMSCTGCNSRKGVQVWRPSPLTPPIP